MSHVILIVTGVIKTAVFNTNICNSNCKAHH